MIARTILMTLVVAMAFAGYAMKLEFFLGSLLSIILFEVLLKLRGK